MATRKKTGIGVGGTSILMVFMVLSLATFATLTLASANADYKLSQRNQQAVVQYYQADGLGEEMFQQIDQLIQANALLSAPEIMAVLQAQLPDITLENPADALFMVTYNVPINEGQQLSIAISYTTPMDYTINRWVVENSVQWEAGDDTLNLWTGEEN